MKNMTTCRACPVQIHDFTQATLRSVRPLLARPPGTCSMIRDRKISSRRSCFAGSAFFLGSPWRNPPDRPPHYDYEKREYRNLKYSPDAHIKVVAKMETSSCDR